MNDLARQKDSSIQPAGKETLGDWWFRTRNRILTSPAFQRWAVRFPVASWVARHRAAKVFELVAGFVYSQVLYTCVTLKLFERLADGPQTVDELAPFLELTPERARRLLDAAVSLKLLERRPNGRYGLGIYGAPLLANPSVAHMVEHHAMLYRDLADPVGLLRGDPTTSELSRYWSYSGRGPGDQSTPQQVAAYSALMASSMSLIAEDILDAYDFGRHRKHIDLAGGEGAFVEAASRTQGLASTLFDLPAVAERARARFSRAGLEGRVTAVGGDLFKGPVPTGFDLATLVRVVHDHDDAQALRILEAARGVLAPGGVLLIAEPMSDTRGAEAMADAYFGFYLYAMAQGRARSPAELDAMARKAGFARTRLVRTRRPMLTRLLVAET
ncbi:MAG: acetylserotonin O-methyltransferase [Myxococcaceae bacterium]|nr:acetylserotonin O-methyltransferase [Myxococcaceae bacterium]